MPEGELTLRGPLEACPQQAGFSGLEDLRLAREVRLMFKLITSASGGWVWEQSQQQHTLGTRTPGGGGYHRLIPPGGQLKELRKTVDRNADGCNKELGN